MRAWGCNNKHFAWYLLQNMMFRCISKRHRKWEATYQTQQPQNRVWAAQGLDFRDFDIFGGSDFNIIFEHLNYSKNQKQIVIGLTCGSRVWKDHSKGGGGGGEGGWRYRRFFIGDMLGDLIWHADLVSRRIYGCWFAPNAEFKSDVQPVAADGPAFIFQWFCAARQDSLRFFVLCERTLFTGARNFPHWLKNILSHVCCIPMGTIMLWCWWLVFRVDVDDVLLLFIL